jgi:hypothetical protein
MAALVPVLLELRHITVRTVLSDHPADEATSLAFVQMISHRSNYVETVDKQFFGRPDVWMSWKRVADEWVRSEEAGSDEW